MHSVKLFFAFALGSVLLAPGLAADPLYIDPADDEKYFGDPEEILRWTPQQQIAGYRNIERLGPARRVPASDSPLVLPRQERDLGKLKVTGEFEEQTFSLSLDEFFVRQRVAGLLVLSDGAIVYERYGLGNTEDSRWISFSVTKSVVSLLIGAAVHEGYIGGVHEKVTSYLPRLKDSPYDDTDVAHLLRMASGVAWNEDYDDPESDVSRATWETLALYEYLAAKPRVAPPGELFNYNTAETNLAGALLRAAIGNNLATYLYHRIWQPFGMEADAWWPLTEEGGGEFGGCCLAATLRDYGRIGLFALRGGRLLDGTRVLPEGWMAESTTPSKSSEHYGYFWWLPGDGSYRASGIFGQGIHIDPTENLVIALQSAREIAYSPKDSRIQAAMYDAIRKALAD